MAKYIVIKSGSGNSLFKVLEGTETPEGLKLPSSIPPGVMTLVAVPAPVVPYEFLIELNKFIKVVAAILGGLALIATNWKKITA